MMITYYSWLTDIYNGWMWKDYIKCGDGIEMIEIYSDNNARLQWYMADGNEMVKIYDSHGANWWMLTVFYVWSLCFLLK